MRVSINSKEKGSDNYEVNCRHNRKQGHHEKMFLINTLTKKYLRKILMVGDDLKLLKTEDLGH